MADNAIPCPSCGYDLRGVAAMGEFYRCPECGWLTNLASLTRVRIHRRMMIRIVLVAGALLLAALLLMYLLR